MVDVRWTARPRAARKDSGRQVVMGKAGLHARGLLVLQPSHDVTGGYAAPSNAGNMRY